MISWADNRTGNWEIFFTKSTDNGKTFADSINGRILQTESQKM